MRASLVGVFAFCLPSAALAASVQAPPNDDFANAATITGTSATVSATNVNATKEAGEPDIASNSGGASVWWTWTAPSDLSVVITTTGSAIDTLLAVYQGTAVNSLTLIRENDDDPLGGLQSRVAFATLAGQTYRIAVDGFNGVEGGIQLNLTTGIYNDDLLNARVITGSSLTLNENNTGTSKETGEPDHAGNSGGRSLWWSWKPPTTDTYVISTEGSSFDTLLGVYIGSAVDSLILTAQDNDGGTGTASQLSFRAAAGEPYKIAVDGFNGDFGTIQLNITRVPGSGGGGAPPPGDDSSDDCGATGAEALLALGLLGIRRRTTSARAASR